MTKNSAESLEPLGHEQPVRAQDPSEEFIFGHCRKLFFPLWSYLNPLRHDGSELCDVLVAFGDHILVISVKHVAFDPEATDPQVAADRWRRRAIDKSSRQAIGAKHYLMKQGSYEVRSLGLTAPVVIEDIASKRIHCISVSLGSKGWVPFSFDEGGRPEDFVHILTEESLDTLLKELSTIDDFTRYLREKEDFFSRTKAIVMQSELDLLALYVRGNRKLPDWSSHDMVMLDGGHWKSLARQRAYKERLRSDKVSELWDLTVADLVKHQVGNTYVAGTGKESMEPLLRRLAAENRFSRRVLSKAMLGVLRGKNGPRARIFKSPDGLLYVFMRLTRAEQQEDVPGELSVRCMVALGLMRQELAELRVIGVATQPIDGNRMRFHVAMMMWYKEWTPELQADMEKFQALGVFRRLQMNRVHEDEYPSDKTTP